MDKYFKYSATNNNRSEIQQVEPPLDLVKLEDITVQSTPKEISNLITQKLVELIDQELKRKTD